MNRTWLEHNKQMLIAHAAHGLRRQPAARLSALNLGVRLGFTIQPLIT
jgi:hypothetical protein